MGHALSVAPPYRKKWAAKEWTALAVLVLGALALQRWLLKPFQSHPTSPQPGVDWFLILRLPELQYNRLGREMGEERLEQWLTALQGARYTPMFLSEALARTGSGAPLPEKTVVLLYQPALRQTIEGVYPLLARHRFPATLVTQSEGIDADDTRFLSRHRLDAFAEEGCFDMGFFGASSMTFTLRPSRRGTAPQKELQLAWDPMAERNVLNAVAGSRTLNRLNVNLAWTGPQLLQRLAAEAPVRSMTHLTATRLLRRLWGTTAPADAPFDLQADEDYRAATVSWNGLKGRKNLRVDITAASIMDELWIYLRYDRAAERGLRVGFTPGYILVELADGGKKDRLLSLPWTAPQGRGFSAAITLAGTRLRIAAPGAPERTVELPDDATPKHALFAAAVFSKIRAVARAQGLNITATPIPE